VPQRKRFLHVIVLSSHHQPAAGSPICAFLRSVGTSVSCPQGSNKRVLGPPTDFPPVVQGPRFCGGVPPPTLTRCENALTTRKKNIHRSMAPARYKKERRVEHFCGPSALELGARRTTQDAAPPCLSRQRPATTLLDRSMLDPPIDSRLEPLKFHAPIPRNPLIHSVHSRVPPTRSYAHSVTELQ